MLVGGDRLSSTARTPQLASASFPVSTSCMAMVNRNNAAVHHDFFRRRLVVVLLPPLLALLGRSDLAGAYTTPALSIIHPTRSRAPGGVTTTVVYWHRDHRGSSRRRSWPSPAGRRRFAGRATAVAPLRASVQDVSTAPGGGSAGEDEVNGGEDHGAKTGRNDDELVVDVSVNPPLVLTADGDDGEAHDDHGETTMSSNSSSTSTSAPVPESSPRGGDRDDEEVISTFASTLDAPAAAEAASAASAAAAGGRRSGGGNKLRVLKDRMWARETLEDLTASEFACRLGVQQREVDDATGAVTTTTTGASPRQKMGKERAVDFENLLQKLDGRVEEMCGRSRRTEEAMDVYPLEVDDIRDREEGGESRRAWFSGTKPKICYALEDGRGMGGVVYSPEQREALLLKIMTTREKVIATMRKPPPVAAASSRDDESATTPEETGGPSGGMQGGGGEEADSEAASASSAASAAVAADLEDIRSKLSPAPGAVAAEVAGGEEVAVAVAVDAGRGGFGGGGGAGGGGGVNPQLYVREDGTVDWEGALQDREALRLFGAEVWARINGQDPSALEEGEGAEQGTSGAVEKEEGADGKQAVRAKIVETEAIRKEKETLLSLEEDLDLMEAKHTALLETGISAGAAVANVNFASLDPALREKIRDSADELERKREEVSFQTLVYELERIFVYLDAEVGNIRGGYIPLQDRLAVAEFGLLESQIDSLSRQLKMEESIDTDVLAVIVDQLTDFKRRLGIDYYVTGLTFDREGILQWAKDLGEQTKKGFAFYVKGCQLFWSDLVFCSSLIGRALQGYTLKPREVRTLRRTFKDVFTFIPFVIILLIPLSPVGHVLVFGAIQRFFPDFFPSCFTERRQNLLQLYESTEYSEVTINESLKDKLIRVVEAIVFTIANVSRRVYVTLVVGPERTRDQKSSSEKDETSQKR